MSSETCPPGLSRAILRLVSPRGERDSIDGDLLQEFRESVLPTRGVRAARWWYRGQVSRSIWPLMTSHVSPGQPRRVLAGTSAALAFAMVLPDLVSRSAWRMTSLPSPSQESLQVINLFVTALFAPLAGWVAAWLSHPFARAAVRLTAAVLALPGLLIAAFGPEASPTWVGVVWAFLIPPLVLSGGGSGFRIFRGDGPAGKGGKHDS